MKTTLQLFGIVLISLLLTHCSSSTGPDTEFKPYKIGSFLVDSPSSAKFVGSSAPSTKMKVDSMVVTDPIGYGLELEHAPDAIISTNAVRYIFTDSTSLHWEQYEDFLSKWADGSLDHPYIRGETFSVGADSIVQVGALIENPCDMTGSRDIAIHYIVADSTHKVSVIRTNGLTETVKEIGQCP